MSRGVILTIASLAGLLWSEANHKTEGVYLFKPLASAGFMLTAFDGPKFRTEYGTLLTVALGLCFVGDVLLMFSEDWAFLTGLASFLLGHMAFAFTFTLKGADTPSVYRALGALAAPAAGVAYWLFPHLEFEFKAPVFLYIAAICIMVACAYGGGVTRYGPAHAIQMAGAVLFFLSDLFVAREQFVTSSFTNKAIGLPLYYAAVTCLAWLLHV